MIRHNVIMAILVRLQVSRKIWLVQKGSAIHLRIQLDLETVSFEQGTHKGMLFGYPLFVNIIHSFERRCVQDGNHYSFSSFAIHSLVESFFGQFIEIELMLRCVWRIVKGGRS